MNYEKKLISQLNIPAKLCNINIRNININYLIAGKGEALILLHGAGIGWGQWYRNIPYLSRYFKVYALDLPGAGGSTKIDYSKINFSKEIVDPLVDFCTKLNIRKTHIIGHSIGAWIALKMLRKKKRLINKLILTNPLGLTDKMPINQFPLAIPFVGKLLASTFMRPTVQNIEVFLRSVLQKKTISSVFVNYVHESVHKGIINHPIVLISRLAGIPKVRSCFVLLEEFKSIKNQILVIGGENDPIVDRVQLKEHTKLNKFSKIKIFFECGHVVPIESSDLFNKTVRNFLISK